MFSLQNKTALITGGASGIGLAIAQAFATAGAHVHILDLNGGQAEQVASEIRRTGRKATGHAVDMSSQQQTVEVIGRIAAQEPIHMLVNNAGVAHIAPLLKLSVEDWDTTMAVNLRAPFLIARELAPQMIARKAGKIINVSSQAGLIAVDDHGAYSSSKGGLNMLTKAMTVEWAKHNIQINSVCPTVILTPMGEKNWGSPEKSGPMLAKIPAGRFGKPVEVADMILYLASSASGLVCGQDILIDGGYTAL